MGVFLLLSIKSLRKEFLLFKHFSRFKNNRMKVRVILFILTVSTGLLKANDPVPFRLLPGYEQRIRNFIDSLHIVDTHEHLYNPESLTKTNFLDIGLLIQQNNEDDLTSVGLPDSLYDIIFNQPVPVLSSRYGKHTCRIPL